jgi:hypothetical protein
LSFFGLERNIYVVFTLLHDRNKENLNKFISV